jgi:diguanylate cyclase (GGDEF)-like protein
MQGCRRAALVTTTIGCASCGAMHESPRCPACGAEYEVRDAAASDRALNGSDRNQTSSDRDQTTSDSDQTLSDRDQTGSDSDQRSADEDQDAADDDLAAGLDAATHNRTTRARERTSHDRLVVSDLRDSIATARLRTASDRDQVADGRDRAASERDARDRAADQNGTGDTSRHDMIMRAERDRSRAALDRAKAAEDRIAAEGDRRAATSERADALRIRSETADAVRLAATDGLTGAWSRTFGLEQAARELERAHRTGTTVLLAFIDVDGLKAVNDRHGHLAGDELLRTVGTSLRRHLRPYDLVIRYGGDEFVCALAHVDAAEARTRFASVLEGLDGGCTFTLGLASSEPDETLVELIARADADLLEARRTR